MAYAIGLDCGTTSVGWAILELDSNDEPKRIIKLGSRIFTAAENPKDGSSLAAPRREKRSLRRRLRRHRHRNERIRELIVSTGILNEDELMHLFDGKLSDIYALRTEALDRKLDCKEFARILINLAQRRGFKSNRKNPVGDAEAGKLLNAVGANSALMQEKCYRTVGEMFYKDEKFSEYKRNKGENYSNTVSRDMIEAEIHSIFNAQRNYGNTFAHETFEEKYTEIVLSQRSFEEGPGGNSKYGGNQIEKMMGKCTLVPEENRAAKASYSFQVFSLWQKINSLKIVSNGESRCLTDNERKEIFNLAHSKADLRFSDIRKKLGLADNEHFNLLKYVKPIEDVEKAGFNYLKAYHEIRKALNKVSKDRIKYFSCEVLNEIGYIFTVYKNDDSIADALKKLELEKYDIDALMTLKNFSKFGHISVKACNALIPFLEQGMQYNEACDAAGFNFRGHEGEKSMFLPRYSEEIADLTNPVVKRSVLQTIRVINAIVREQNESPVYINIELAREMSKNFNDRMKDIKRNEENRAANERALEQIKNEFKIPNPSGQDLVKYKLWKEQDGICPYSLQPIKIEHLFENGYAEVDHVFPYSISFDDSYKNKVLVLTKENREKGNRLPLQYLTGKRRDDYIVWVNNNVKDYRKRQIMLKEKISKEDTENLKQRSLQDTQYLSRFLYNYINDYMSFAPSVSGKKQRVNAVNGAVTAYVRKRWGISKIREDGDLHHAADAVVVGCVTHGMIKRISSYSKYNENRYLVTSVDDPTLIIDSDTGEIVDKFPYPWPTFRKELEIRLMNDPKRMLDEVLLPNYSSEDVEEVRPCFVSRMATRKSKGSAHKDTVRSPKMLGDGMVVTKTALTKLKLKNGEIEGYYNPESDKLLYNALKTRLLTFGGNAEKAFAEPFFKPTKSGENGHEVKKVKIYEKSSLNVELNDGKGVASNDQMVRIDIFKVENDGYYFVPIYVADTIKDVLPNKAVVANKTYSEWKEMKDEDFVFSLYSNDLVLIKSKKPIKMSLKNQESTLPKEHIVDKELLYYVKAGISTGSVTVLNHDGSYILPSLGIKTLMSIEKYEVDTLGNCHKAGRETRKAFGE